MYVRILVVFAFYGMWSLRTNTGFITGAHGLHPEELHCALPAAADCRHFSGYLFFNTTVHVTAHCTGQERNF